MKSYIKKAALKYEGERNTYFITVGKNHGEAFMVAQEEFNSKIWEGTESNVNRLDYKKTPDQGFINEQGNFLSRKDAFKVAVEADQIIGTHGKIKCLTSDDMIWDENNDSFKHGVPNE